MDAETVNEQIAERSGACPQCVERCHREHHPVAAGRLGRFASALTHPCFLRTVVENHMRSNMAIPKAFMDAHGQSMRGSTVDLEGSNGTVWLVTVDVSSKGVASFRFGWQVFADDNNLKAGDSLLFTMVAEKRFTVRVFTKSGLESLSNVLTISNSSHTTHDSRLPPESQSKGMHHMRDESEGFFVSQNGNSEGSDYDYDGLGSDFETAHPWEGNGGDGPSIRDILEANSHRTGELMRTKIKRKLCRTRKTSHYNQELSSLEPGWNSKVWESRRRPVTDEERKRVVAAAQKFVTERPSTYVVMMPSHVYRGFWLTLPLEFSRLHMPQRRVHITLQDASGFQWPDCQWIIDSHRAGVSGGWAAFSRDHHLEEGDACVFEVLDLNNPTILVHIFRVLEVALVPGSRGGWDVKYNVVDNRLRQCSSTPRSDGFSPDEEAKRDVIAVKAEATNDGNPQRRRSLAQVLHSMVRNGQFSKRQRENNFVSSKIRALVEEESFEDVKPDIEAPGPSQPMRLALSPIYLSSDSTVKIENVENVSPIVPSTSTLPASVEVKTEPIGDVKVEDCDISVSPVSVYTRRRRSDGLSTSYKRTGSENEDEKIWCPVGRVLDKRQLGDKAEKDLMVEIIGAGPGNETSLQVVERGPDAGMWWVPISHFSLDMSSFYFS